MASVPCYIKEYCTEINPPKETKDKMKSKRNTLSLLSDVEVEESMLVCFLFIIRADPGILKSGGALCQPPWLADEENVRFQIV